jgi:Zn-dependent protease with chaperone function
MITNNRRAMGRKWVEGIIIGVCIALVVVLVQPLVVGGDGWFQAGGLLLAIALVCALQLALSFWKRPDDS